MHNSGVNAEDISINRLRSHLPHYFVVLTLFGLALWAIFQMAPHWITAQHASGTASGIASSKAGALSSLKSPMALLLIQLVIIISVAKIFGVLSKRIGQPAVIGEMLAGILLGPSLLGILAPEFQTSLFPTASLSAIRTLSEIGVVVFMFAVGAELDLKIFKREAHTALLVSHTSIFFPFVLGAATAIGIYAEFATPGLNPQVFCLFIGIAMSVTAFPVLAGILRERKLISTPLGTTALVCAAIDDVTAWCILAVIVTFTRANDWYSGITTVGLSIAYIVFMLVAVRPLLARITQGVEGKGSLMIGTVLYMFASASITEMIGIHALFGAFLAGVTVSNVQPIRRCFFEYIEPFSVAVLLPLFFAYTGLRTKLSLIGGIDGWLFCLMFIGIASLGKLGGGTAAAKMAGFTWKNALSIGVLMNTRGLMELVVLNIGMDLGVLSPRLFAVMVVMALVTTFMTGPLLSIIDRTARLRGGASTAPP